MKNALRSAQLDKRELLLWRKFGYGPSLFRQYYRAQDLMDGDDELEEVEACYSTALPITFRTPRHRREARVFAEGAS